MSAVKVYIEDGVKANIQVTRKELENICSEYDLSFIGMYAYDPTYMSGEELNITGSNDVEKRYKLPAKKPVTAEYVIGRINAMKNTDKAYINLSKVFRKISDKYSDFNIYPTTYGIGVHTIFSDTSEEFREILDVLDDSGVKYRLEYSDALWVKRIIISKSKENMEKVAALKI